MACGVMRACDPLAILSIADCIALSQRTVLAQSQSAANALLTSEPSTCVRTSLDSRPSVVVNEPRLCHRGGGWVGALKPRRGRYPNCLVPSVAEHFCPEADLTHPSP